MLGWAHSLVFKWKQRLHVESACRRRSIVALVIWLREDGNMRCLHCLPMQQRDKQNCKIGFEIFRKCPWRSQAVHLFIRVSNQRRANVVTPEQNCIPCSGISPKAELKVHVFLDVCYQRGCKEVIYSTSVKMYVFILPTRLQSLFIHSPADRI